MAIILRLDRVMADRKISLNELAEKVGITNVNMSNIKTGKISAIRFSTLNGICGTDGYPRFQCLLEKERAQCKEHQSDDVVIPYGETVRVSHGYGPHDLEQAGDEDDLPSVIHQAPPTVRFRPTIPMMISRIRTILTDVAFSL